MNLPDVPQDWQDAINKLLVDGSVLDLCCGSGRFYPLFQTREYTGVDKDPNFAKTLSERWPEATWTTADVADYVPDKRYDNVFTWVALQHIKPEQIEGVARMMRNCGRNVLMCERMTGADPGDSGYLWKHDYATLFPGMRPYKQIVADVWLMHWANPEVLTFETEGIVNLKEGVRVLANGRFMSDGKFIKKEEAFK